MNTEPNLAYCAKHGGYNALYGCSRCRDDAMDFSATYPVIIKDAVSPKKTKFIWKNPRSRVKR